MGVPGHFADEHFTPTAITTTFPVMVTIVGHPFVNEQRVRATRFVTTPLADATGMEQLNGRLFVINECTADTFKLFNEYDDGIDGRAYTPFINNGLAQFTLTGPALYTQNPPPPNVYTERIYPWL